MNIITLIQRIKFEWQWSSDPNSYFNLEIILIVLLPHICCPVAKEMAADSSNDEAEEGDHPKKEPLSPASSTISDDDNDGKNIRNIVVNYTRIHKIH